MRNIIYSALIFLLSINLQAQTSINSKDIDIQHVEKIKIYKTKDGNILDGHYKIESSDGTFTDLHLKNGKLNGDYTIHRKDKSVRVKGNYVVGLQNGEWIYYDSNGEISSTESYKKGLKDGKWTKRNGRIIEFYKDDKPFGHWEERDADGDLKRTKEYSAKEAYIQKDYFSNGKVEEEKSYKNSKLDGVQKVFSEEGVLLSKEVYKDGEIQELETYSSHGKLVTKKSYKNGILHGKYIQNQADRVKSLEGNYENGKESGIWRQYRGNGSWVYYENTYKNGELNGPAKIFYKNGKIEYEGNYKDDERDGTWKYYNFEGKLDREETFKNGERISTKRYK